MTAPPSGAPSVVSGFLLNLGGRLAAVLAGGVIGILLARHYGAETFGMWSAAAVYGTLVLTVIEGGLGRILIREASRDPRQTGPMLGAVVKARVWISLVAVPTALAAAWWTDPIWSSWLLVLLLVLAKQVEGLQSSFFSALFAQHHFAAPNLIETARRLVLFVGIGTVVWLDGPIWAAAVVSLAVMLLSTWPVLRAAANVGIHIEAAQDLRTHRNDAFWFWLGGILFWINGEVDQLMLNGLQGPEATGLYAAPMRLIAFFFVIPVAVNNTIIPRLFRSAKSGVNLLAHLNGSTLLLAALGGLIGLEFYLGHEVLIDLVYGDDFSRSAGVLAILSLYVAVDFMRMAPSWYIAASDRVALNTAFLLVASVGNVVMNAWLIPEMGPMGAAWATVGSSVLLLVLVGGVTAVLTGPRFLLALGLGAIVPLSFGFGVHRVLTPYLGYWPRSILLALVSGAGLGAIFWRMRQTGGPRWLFGTQDDAPE